jgi:hypothetical protein
LAVLVLFLFSINSSNLLFSGIIFSPITRTFFWSLVSNFLLLTWLGRCPAESPYTEVALYLTISYFILVILCVSWSHIVSLFYLKS